MRGQASIEVIIAVAMVLMVFMFAVVINSNMGVQARDLKGFLGDRAKCLETASAISGVWASGEGLELMMQSDGVEIWSDGLVRVGRVFCTFQGRSNNFTTSGATLLNNTGSMVVISGA